MYLAHCQKASVTSLEWPFLPLNSRIWILLENPSFFFLPIHTGGGLIKSHFWLEIPLKLDHQPIQIKVLVCDSECPYDLILGRTSTAQLSAWQGY